MDTTRSAALLAECLATPDDDAPRLVWADDQGGERGELVVLECELVRGAATAADSGVRRQRERELLDQHGAAWSGLAGLAKHCRFRRGFVELATFDAAMFCDRADEIVERAPFLRAVRLEDVTIEVAERLFDHPVYARLRGLALTTYAGPPDSADAAFARHIARGVFAHLESLDLGMLRPASAHELVASKQLRGVARLAFGPVSVTEDALPALLATTPDLRALDIKFVRDPLALVPVLPPKLTELEIPATALPALAQSPLARGLEKLRLAEVTATGALPELAAFPRLRSLDLAMSRGMMSSQPRPELGPAFAATPLPALRELRCSQVSPAGVRAIAEAIGGQLELLGVIGTDPDGAFAALRPLVAGDLFVSPFVAAAPPLFAGELPHAPMWDYPFVRFPRPVR